MMELKLRSLSLVALLIATAAGCAISRPFSGPGLAAHGIAADDPRETVTVVITHAKLDNSRRGPFDDYTRRLVEALDSGEFAGLVGFSVRKELLGNEVWTMSTWTDHAAVDRFAGSALHREAIARARHAIVSLRVRYVRVAPADVPLSWERALWHLEQPRHDVKTPS